MIDPTETALINLGDKLGCPAETIREKYPRCSEVPFDSDRKLMSTLHNLKNGCTMVTKGAVDVLLGRVSHIQKNGEVCPINSYDLMHFMRDFRVVKIEKDSYINISRDQAVNEKVKELTGLTTLDALYLSEKEVENLFKNCMLLDS